MKKFLNVMLTIGGVTNILLWLAILFFAFLLGGSPAPSYERTVPFMYANIICNVGRDGIFTV